MALQPRPVVAHARPPPLPPCRVPARVVDELDTAVNSSDSLSFKRILDAYIDSDPKSRSNISDLYRTMLNAIWEGGTEFVSILMDSGLPMHYIYAKQAIHSRSKPILAVFLQHGWDINQPISGTEPPILGYAMTDPEITQWLLDHGADMNRRTGIDLTPLSYAVELAPLSLVEELLGRGGDVHKGELLHHAMDRSSDRVKVLALLLDRGAPLNTRMYENDNASARLYPFMGLGTPLHKAVNIENVECVRYLIERGANINIRDTKGQSARELAEKLGNQDILKEFDVDSATHLVSSLR